MAAGSALNLSLLSRGIGEVKRNGSEKVDVIFEPQDYFNFVEESHERPFFLPPLQPRYGFSEPSQISSRYSSKDAVYLPKTFTTRKGALLLFSEDMAHKTKKAEAKKHKSMHGINSDRDVSLDDQNGENTDQDLKTVDDLAKSILAYGSIDDVGKMNLKFMVQKQRRRNDFERQIRPGFSAKRYLSTWTKTWDDNTLEKVISKGYLTEKSLFYYNPLLPHLSRRLNDDLSHYPTPYKLMRSMLMSPGSLSGYTFYRVRPESQETDYYEIDEEDEMQTLTKAGSVKVASVTADGHIKEAVYGQLDRQAQTEVLTDLLVKGAVHYAMKTQQEYVEKMDDIDEGSEVKVVPKFDMREAVETMLLDTEQKGAPQQLLDANLPDKDDRSQHSGSFKGGKLGTHRSRGHGDTLTSARDDSSSVSSGGAPGPLPGPGPLPPIGQTYTMLTPIGEASREHTQAYSLKVQEDDDDDEGWAGRGVVEKPQDQKGHMGDDKRRLDMEKRKARVSAQSLDIDGPTAGGQLMSGSESAGPGSTHSSGWLPPVHKQQWKGSQQSYRSHGSRRAYANDESDAEVPDDWKDNQRPHSGQMSESHRKLPKRETPSRTSVTEQEIIDKLTSHATHIAESVLSQSESGQVLEEDIRFISNTIAQVRFAQRVISPRPSPRQKRLTVIQEVMKGQKRKSAGPTVAEYRDKIKGNLMTALANATGLNQSDIPQDAEIDPELMEQLANNTLAPDDIEIVRDEETGRSFIRSRNRVISEAMGGVEKGHIYQPAAKSFQLSFSGPAALLPSRQTSVLKGSKTKPRVLGERRRSKVPEQSSKDDEPMLTGHRTKPIVQDENKLEGLKASGTKPDHELGRKGQKVKFKNPEPIIIIEDTSEDVVVNDEAWHGDIVITEADSKGLIDGEAGKRVSIPTDKKPADIGELDIINFQSHDEAKQPSDRGSDVGSKKGSMKSGGDAKSKKSASDEDLQKELDGLSQGSSPTGPTSLKSGKSGEKSKVGSEKKGPSPDKEKKKDEFVVASGVDHTKENTKLYGIPPNQPAGTRKPKAKKEGKATVGKKKGEKGKKPKGKGKKKDEAAEEPTAVETAPEEEKAPTPPKAKTPQPESPPLERSISKEEESDDEEYIIVRDETMSPENEAPDKNLNITTSAEEEEPDEEQITAEDLEDLSEADKLRMISNREARAAKRAAAAEKRRQEVERKRKEREEQIKREKEESERQEKLKQEQEDLRKQKEEERRLKKQREEEENEEIMQEELEQQRREKAEVEREKRRKEEYARKLEDMKRKQLEEERKRQEEAEKRRLVEEEKRKEEEEMMAKMAEDDRLEYERKKKEAEEERMRKELEEKKRREEEAQRALEEARRLAEEMARKQAELEARLRFNRSLQMESNGLEHTQDITKAFVFSYFELLQWLGLDIPEFELLKLNQY